MTTLYSCYICGEDVDEDAKTRQFAEIPECEMPVCDECLTRGEYERWTTEISWP